MKHCLIEPLEARIAPAAVLTITAPNPSAEGASGNTDAAFVVKLSTHSGIVTVHFATQDGSGTVAGGDYQSVSGTLTFAANETEKLIMVPIKGDAQGELDETFRVLLDTPTGDATLGQNAATATILNDDTAFRIDSVQVAEGGANSTAQAVFTVSLDRGAATGNLLVDIATQDGTAVSIGATPDFTARTATLTFAPGETTKTFSVPVNGDVSAEGNEMFTARLSNPRGSAPLTNALASDTGTATILNDDGLFFTVNDVTISEGDAGTANAIFLVRISSAPASDVQVDVRTVDGTATSSGAIADFDALTQTLVFNSSTTQQFVKVPIRGDRVDEVTEMFSVLLSNARFTTPGATAVSILKDTGTGTITDDGDPTPTVSISNGALAEGNGGPSALFFEVKLSNPSSAFVSVNFDTKDGTGANAATIADSDYTAVSNGTLTFQPGQTSAFISVPVLGDTRDEADETFGVTLKTPNGATLGVASALGTIRNDEITVSIGDSTVVEGNNGTKNITFQVSLNAAPVGHDVTVNFSTLDGTALGSGNQADFVAKTGTLTFAAGGGLTKQITVVVNGDTRIEGDENFLVQLAGATNATLVDAQATGTITNDEASPVVSIGPAQATEGDAGATPLAFIVSLNGPSDLPVTVRAQTFNGTAVAGTAGNGDYTAVDQMITFAPGETSKLFSVPVLSDTVDESSENLTVQLSAATNATLGTATGTGTILDNDQPIITIANASIVEGNSGTQALQFTVSLSKAATRAISVNYATADGSATSTGAGADYTATTGTLNFAASSRTQTFTVPIRGDTVAGEGTERFFVNLSNAQNGVLGSDPQGVGFIVDDESTVRLEPFGATTVSEEVAGDPTGETLVKFRVVREGDLSKAVSVDFTTVDGVATSTGARPDFTAQAGTITFAAGSATADGIISVPITPDLNYETNETFQVKLSGAINAAVLDTNGSPALSTARTVTIANTDVAPTVSIGDAEITEGDTGTKTLLIPVTLSAANEVDNQVSVDFTLADGTARSAASGNFLQDYQFGTGMTSATTGTVVFAKGQIAQSIAVQINGDARDEVDAETFGILLSNQKNGTTVQANGITDGTATATILDNDAAPTLTLSRTGGGGPDQSVNEGNSGTTLAGFTVTLSAVSERDVSVAVQTVDGTAVGSGPRPDFVGLGGDFRLTFPAGATQLTQTFSVQVNGDPTDEATETFQVLLSDARFSAFSDGSATVTIIDDDVAPSVVVNDVSLSEGDAGPKEMVFTVSLSALSEQAVSVSFATKDGTAFSTGPLADYTATNGTLNFAAGELTKEVRVTLRGDTYAEPDELFSVELTAGKNGTIAKASGAGTILADGDTQVGIAVRDAFLREGDSGTSSMIFTVELAGPRDTATAFNVSTRGGTAVSGVDFTKLSAFAGTIQNGQRTATVAVPITGDGIFESTENFFVDLGGVPTGVQVVAGSARGTIYNDDLRQLDARTIQFIDVDGDLATVHVSQGVLSTADLSFGPVNAIGGRQLGNINFTDDGTEFQGTNLRVSAVTQPGFLGDPQGVRGDGHVNVGFIQAAIPQSDILQFTGGIDFGTVKIDGDLGKIVAGDNGATSAIGKLKVRSFGALGTSTQGTSSSLDTLSEVLGPIGSIVVRGDFAGTLRVIGEQFGRIDDLHIGGTLLGGATNNSGQIFFTGTLQHAFINQIAGGTGTNSGFINGSFSSGAKIGTIFVGGTLLGGAGSGSGQITAPTVTKLSFGAIQGGTGPQSGLVATDNLQTIIVRNDVTGGAGANSGEIFATNRLGSVQIDSLIGASGSEAGSVVANGSLGKLRISEGIIGGKGSESGTIQVAGRVQSASIHGITGGAGADSGGVQVGKNLLDLHIGGDVRGGTGNGSGGVNVGRTLVSGVVSRSVIGGDSAARTVDTPATTLFQSGFIYAKNIGQLEIRKNLEAGDDNGVGLAGSGTIRASNRIDVLRIDGDVLGNAGTAAIISAAGTAEKPVAIRRLIVGGDLRFAEILAGYQTDASLTKERGSVLNADARIGTVKIGGDFGSSSVVAGVAAGADGIFGSADDALIGGTGTRDVAKDFSKIARIVIAGTVLPGTASAGIVAQQLATVRVAGEALPLTRGPGNDLNRDTLLAPGSNVHVFELPKPA